MKNEIKGERIERIPMQRGEEGNFAGVLSRLAASRATFVLLT